MKFSIILLTFIFLSCVSTKNTMPLVQSISAEDAKKILEKTRPSRLLLIDGRSEQMYASGHIVGATLIDARQEDTTEKLRSILRYRAIMIYCTTNNRTGEIVEILQRLGYNRKIYTLTGGINAWREAGFEIISY